MQYVVCRAASANQTNRNQKAAGVLCNVNPDWLLQLIKTEAATGDGA